MLAPHLARRAPDEPEQGVQAADGERADQQAVMAQKV
jgi:hypothetical protein